VTHYGAYSLSVATELLVYRMDLSVRTVFDMQKH